MGCVHFKSKNNTRQLEITPQKKEYSWDKRVKLNPKDYTIENIENDIIIKEPNSVNGRQFIIQNCKESYIYIIDYCNTVTIDYCTNCKILIGPTSGSVFVRNCENCFIVALSGQFRARDCLNLNLYLCCTSQPSIESCSRMKFACCQLNYEKLSEQLSRANICPFNNQWFKVYDFTPVPSEGPNWSISDYHQISSILPTDNENENLSKLNISIGNELTSLIPNSTGNISSSQNSNNSCLVIVLPALDQIENAYNFISKINKSSVKSHELVESKERILNLIDTTELLQQSETLLSRFTTSADNKLKFIGLHFKGPECIYTCQQLSATLISPDNLENYIVSTNYKSAAQQINYFMNILDL